MLGSISDDCQPFHFPLFFAAKHLIDCFTLNINEFRCYKVKIEESEKAGSRRKSNQRHISLEPPVLCH